MPYEDPGVGLIDRYVAQILERRKNGPSDTGQRSETATPHLRPARPAAIEPPVVMVCNEWNAALRAKARQFSRQEQIPANAEVVRPDKCVFSVGIREQALPRGADSSGCRSGPLALLGDVAYRWFDDVTDRNAVELRLKKTAPPGVSGLAHYQHHRVNRQTRSTHNMRRRQLNDASDAAGAKMKMDDDQFQDLKTLAADARLGQRAVSIF